MSDSVQKRIEALERQEQRQAKPPPPAVILARYLAMSGQRVDGIEFIRRLNLLNRASRCVAEMQGVALSEPVDMPAWLAALAMDGVLQFKEQENEKPMGCNP